MRKGYTCNDATCKACVRAQVRAEKEMVKLREATKRRVAEYHQSANELSHSSNCASKTGAECDCNDEAGY